VHAEPLGCRQFAPVASPALAARIGRVGDLGQVPVIEDRSTMLSWSLWFEAMGGPAPVMHGPRYSDPALAYEAAIAGQGVLLAVDRMSEDAVQAGQLVRPFARSGESPHDYWFVTSTLRRMPRKVVQFRDWLMSELAS